MITPSLSDLDYLVGWPPGTKGEAEDRKMIRGLLQLCTRHGFGRVPQVAACIEDIWRNPDRIERYQSLKTQGLDYMADCRAADEVAP